MIQEMWKLKEQQSMAPLSVPGASSAGSIRVVSGSGFRYVVPFPYRLHEMLSNVDEKHDSSIVSWLPDGKHFKVHDPRRFVELVIPSAFKQKSLKSFQRQLHLYGFQRVHDGVDKGAYYHEKFRRDDRDLCLSITRTKAPKRSRTTNTIQKNQKFSQKQPIFQSQKIVHADAPTSNELNNPPASNTIMSANAISPTIFDDVSPLQQSSLIPENNCSMKGPLHKESVPSIISFDGPSSSKPEESSTSRHDGTLNETFPQQLKAYQQLDSSIADTCQWLINAGVPISAFDPVAISDISQSTFAIPQLVPSTSAFSPATPQQSSFTEAASGNTCSSQDTTPAEKNKVDPLRSHSGNTTASDINHPHMSDSHSTQNLISYQSGVAAFDNELLLTDLLPGENLPLVDDSLWAL